MTVKENDAVESTDLSTNYLCDKDGEPYTSATFNWQEYLQEQVDDLRLLEYSEGRRVLTRLDPVLFALVYCRDLLKNDEDEVTFSDLHMELYRRARSWIATPKGKEQRHAYIAPRGGGKSTLAFKILPLWAAAHGHLEFIVAFSSSGLQAMTHLSGFRRLLDTNQMLQKDFPDLCNPARRPNGNSVADSSDMMHRKNGFSFAARGLDSEVLGLVDPLNRRPQCILLDDIEPDEANYSEYQMRKRLTTITDTVFPMNYRAHVLLSGTVTMPGSLVHQLVKSVTSDEPIDRWIIEENMQVHYVPPIVEMPDGTERSFWEGKFPFDLGDPMAGGLKYERHTRAFKKNMQNHPVGEDGEFWDSSDFKYGDVEGRKVLLQIDPAVTDKKTSDFSALAVIAYEPAKRGKDSVSKDSMAKCAVRHIESVKLPPAKLRERVLSLISDFPEIGAVRVEVNQGGETWRSVFHDLPVKMIVHNESVPKKVRAANTLNHYQRGRVLHAKQFSKLEDQMMSFPHVLNDDMIDAVGAGVQFFLQPKPRMGTKSVNYTRSGG